MSRDVAVGHPRQTIAEAARMMAEKDAGALPVGDNDRLVGVITDRDIAIRAVAKGLGNETPVSAVMSREVLYCFDDDELEDVAQNMGEQKVRRLPVVNRDKRLVGIIALADIAASAGRATTADAVANISLPGGKHDQAAY
jgi:CBS domain-containing protein